MNRHQKFINRKVREIFNLKTIRWDIAAAIIAFLSFTAAIVMPFVMSYIADMKKTIVYTYVFDNKLNDSELNSLQTVSCFNRGEGMRSDAYACSRENLIFAPCFTFHTTDINGIIVCPDDPRITPTIYRADFKESEKYAEPNMNYYRTQPTPWYIYLSDGEECRYIRGVTALVANKRMDYSCKNSNITLYLPLDSNDGVYTISCLKNRALEQCKIKEMWL